MRLDVTFEQCVVGDFCEGDLFDAVLAETKLCEVRHARVIVTRFEAQPNEAWLWLIGSKDDAAVMVGVRAGRHELSVVLADDFVDRPVHLMACSRAVVN